MELLFVILIAFVIGLIAWVLLPGRDNYGSMLVPSVAAAVSAVVWVSLTWAGLKYDAGWIWVISLLVGAAVGLVLAFVIPRGRRTGDAEMLQRLSRA